MPEATLPVTGNRSRSNSGAISASESAWGRAGMSRGGNTTARATGGVGLGSAVFRPVLSLLGRGTELTLAGSGGTTELRSGGPSLGLTAFRPKAGVRERSATTPGIPAAGVCFLDEGGGGREEAGVPAAGDSERGAELGRNPASALGTAVPPAGDSLRAGIVLGRAAGELEAPAEDDEPAVCAGIPLAGVGLRMGVALGRVGLGEPSPLCAGTPLAGIGLRASVVLDRPATDAAPRPWAGMPLGGLDERNGAALGRAASFSALPGFVPLDADGRVSTFGDLSAALDAVLVLLSFVVEGSGLAEVPC